MAKSVYDDLDDNDHFGRLSSVNYNCASCHQELNANYHNLDHYICDCGESWCRSCILSIIETEGSHRFEWEQDDPGSQGLVCLVSCPACQSIRESVYDNLDDVDQFEDDYTDDYTYDLCDGCNTYYTRDGLYDDEDSIAGVCDTCNSTWCDECVEKFQANFYYPNDAIISCPNCQSRRK